MAPDRTADAAEYWVFLSASWPPMRPVSQIAWALMVIRGAILVGEVLCQEMRPRPCRSCREVLRPRVRDSFRARLIIAHAPFPCRNEAGLNPRDCATFATRRPFRSPSGPTDANWAAHRAGGSAPIREKRQRSSASQGTAPSPASLLKPFLKLHLRPR